MLILEDESEILEMGYPTLVPLLVEETDGDVEIEAYAGIEDIATEFHARFLNNPFTKEAIDWLDGKLRPYVEGLGYLRECIGKYRWYLSYEASDPRDLAVDRIRPDSVRLCDGDYDVRVSFSMVEQMDKELPAYVTLLGDKIVSIATVNEHDPDQRVLEITVETAPEYRQKGYALSNAVALAKDLLEQGYRVGYAVSRYNRASQKLAKKAGFRRTGRFYAYTAYKL
ncbi:MAG: GNAT family N-acetyltransferase [Eubacteriales bacterium]